MEYLLIFIVLLIILVAAGSAAKKKHLSGEQGEKKVSDSLDSNMEDGEIIINDFIAKRNRTGTASIQIDHIFLSHKGIFVIETKDYRGRIYGDAFQNSWTQVLAYGNTKNKLYNPIKQNETHLNYVKKLIGWNYSYFNVVVFVKADISRVSNADGVLFTLRNFQRWYRNLTTGCYISSDEIIKIKEKIEKEMKENFITKEEHILNVKKNH